MMLRLLMLVTGGVMTTMLVLLCLGDAPFFAFRFADAKVGSDDAGYSGSSSGCGGWETDNDGKDDEDCFKDTSSDKIASFGADSTIILTNLESSSHVTGNTTGARRRTERDGKRRTGKQRGRPRSQGGTTIGPDGSPYVDLLRLSDFCPESFPVIRLNFVRTLINCMTSSKSFILDASSTGGLPLTSVTTWLTFNYTEVQLESSTFNWDHYQRASLTDEGTTSGAGTRTEADNCSTSASCKTFESDVRASNEKPGEHSTLTDDDIYVEYSEENLIVTDLVGDLAATMALSTSSGTSGVAVATSEQRSTPEQNIRDGNSPHESSHPTEKPSRVLENDSTTTRKSSSAINSSNSAGKTSAAKTEASPGSRSPQDSSMSSNPLRPDPSPVALNTYNVTPRPSRATTPTKHPTAPPRFASTVPRDPASPTPPWPPRVSHPSVFTKPILLEHVPVFSSATEDGRNTVRKHQQQLRILSVGLIIGIIAAILLLVVLLVLAAYTARVLMKRYRRRPRQSRANAETNTTLTKAPVANGPNGGPGHSSDDIAPAPKTTEQTEKVKPRDVVEWYV